MVTRAKPRDPQARAAQLAIDLAWLLKEWQAERLARGRTENSLRIALFDVTQQSHEPAVIELARRALKGEEG